MLISLPCILFFHPSFNKDFIHKFIADKMTYKDLEAWPSATFWFLLFQRTNLLSPAPFFLVSLTVLSSISILIRSFILVQLSFRPQRVQSQISQQSNPRLKPWACWRRHWLPRLKAWLGGMMDELGFSLISNFNSFSVITWFRIKFNSQFQFQKDRFWIYALIGNP